jgi:hypothetical protein
MNKLNRTPPVEIRKLLRREVGYGCPINNCNNPYLYWHHFDPTWNEKEHHDPVGMIALCAEHHAKADAGSWTKEQLRTIKENAKENSSVVTGHFDWMRNDLLAIVGCNYFYRTPIIFEFKGQPIIWFNRDEEGNFLLNVKMLSTSIGPRLFIEDNFWTNEGNPIDLEAPPSGKLIKVNYENEDSLKVEFFEIALRDDLLNRYPNFSLLWKIKFPITAVEIHYKVGNTEIEFGPQYTTIPGIKTYNGFFDNCKVGICLK